MAIVAVFRWKYPASRGHRRLLLFHT